MKSFKNFKSLCNYTKNPLSYKKKTLYSDNGVLRCYSNNKMDIILDNKIIFYYIDNFKIRNSFKINKQTKKKVRVYLKREKYIYDYGFYRVIGFYKCYVKLEK